MSSFFKKHPNYIVGFFLWILSLAFVFVAPKLGLFKKKCESCKEYSNFVAALSAEQKAKIALWEASVINIDNKYFYIGETSQNEFDLLKNNKIQYTSMNPIIDESIKRLIIANSILKSLSTEDRNSIINHQAAILFRNSEYILVRSKTDLSVKRSN